MHNKTVLPDLEHLANEFRQSKFFPVGYRQTYRDMEDVKSRKRK